MNHDLIFSAALRTVSQLNPGGRVPIVLTQKTRCFPSFIKQRVKCWQLEGCLPQSSLKIKKTAILIFRQKGTEFSGIILSLAVYFFFVTVVMKCSLRKS